MAELLEKTQRAYTLRLQRASGKCDICGKDDCSCWREALWNTHEAVNKGAKVFGDWLLTLRGGLSHTLADEPPLSDDDIEKELKALKKEAKANERNEPSFDDAKRSAEEKREARIRNKRIVLALSWLSVESERGAPQKFFVKHQRNEETNERSKWETEEELREILKNRGLNRNEIESWIKDCKASLSSAIRHDAVWVNRSKAFDELINNLMTHDEVWDMLGFFFKDQKTYVAPAEGPKDSEDEAADSEEEEAKDLVKNAGQWLSSRFGEGKGADFARMAGNYGKISNLSSQIMPGVTGKEAIEKLAKHLEVRDLAGILDLISGPGYKSATRNFLKEIDNKKIVTTEDLEKLKELAIEDQGKCKSKIGLKGRRSYSDMIMKEVEDACGFTYLQQNGPSRHSEFAVMLDHAARRVSIAHTWIKRAEARRRQFEEDAGRLSKVPPIISDWLDKFCSDRSEISGALEEYRIRRRAVDGWDKIVEKWAKCSSKEERIKAIEKVQGECQANDDKFGDAQLFEALAEDDAICVWHKNGNPQEEPDPQPLIDYVAAKEAEYNKRRFKVPAYRHPDPFMHPVFCDFGCSRWDINFAIHRASQELSETTQKIERKKAELEKAENALSKVEKLNDITKISPAHKKRDECREVLAEAQRRCAWLMSPRALSMKLATGNNKVVDITTLCWQSKRLAHDLGLNTKDSSGEASDVTRADRLGRAASGISDKDPVKIKDLFEEAEWNGRLQAPRGQLEAIARRVEKHGWDEKAKRMLDNIKWLVTFSARLRPYGPWVEYTKSFSEDSFPKPLVGAREYFVKYSDNDSRSSLSKHILSRLPGLRLLAVDLGHRYAAACAVWETLSAKKFQDEIAGKTILRGGTDANAIYCHVEDEKDGKKRTIIYRRIGADILPDGNPHPAPWARLDRQFLIKLQGEDEKARMARRNEIKKVERMEGEFGRFRKAPNNSECPNDEQGGNASSPACVDESGLPKRVDELMSEAVRIMRLALQRHGRRARIAYNLTAEDKLLPGGRKEKMEPEERVALLAETLADWHEICESRRWKDDFASSLWDEYLKAFDADIEAIKNAIEGEKDAVSDDEEETARARRKKREKLIAVLKPIAQKLADDMPLCKEISKRWAAYWSEEDEKIKKWLLWLRRWILPRGKKFATVRSIRRVGGLSLTRIATIKSLYQVQKAFRMRPEPDDPRKNIPARGDESLEDFGAKILKTVEKMREQRVKQLASRIVEAALGIGSENYEEHWEKKRKRPRRPIDDPRFRPCHAVVIENLTHYRPEETRTRRENRQLMTWAAGQVKKYLAEACQLHGLYLREIQPAYTSRQDSRTGAPGARCQDVPVTEFMKSPLWRRQVKQALKKSKEQSADARVRLLCELDEYCEKHKADWKNRQPEKKAEEKEPLLRIPLKGGEIFVSSDVNSPAAKGIQADLNAAANIGLRAIMDPDWPGKWWYIPCERSTFKPAKDKVAGSSAISLDEPLKKDSETDSSGAKQKRRKSGKKGSEIVNLWRDVSSKPISADDGWREFEPYWNAVTAKVVEILRQQSKEKDWPF